MYIKIGIQILHEDELLTLKALFDDPEIEIYSWLAHQYEEEKLLRCDCLVLFARRHWQYIKFNKPYLLILADYVTDQKAIDLTKTRLIGLTGYRYIDNSQFKGYLCGSSELFDAVTAQKIDAVFYHKKYPFHQIFNTLQQKKAIDKPLEIVSLINNYKSTASEYKWRRPANSFKIYSSIAKEVTKFQFKLYGAPNNQLSFEESNTVQFKARYTIHIKYWGHVCNAVVKSLALGTPVIMDRATFEKGRYDAYITNGKNGLVFDSKEEIIEFLNSSNEEAVWQVLKTNCIHDASKWHFPYASEDKMVIKNLLLNITPKKD